MHLALPTKWIKTTRKLVVYCSAKVLLISVACSLNTNITNKHLQDARMLNLSE